MACTANETSSKDNSSSDVSISESKSSESKETASSSSSSAENTDTDKRTGTIGEWVVTDAYNGKTKGQDDVDVQVVEISDNQELINSLIADYTGIYDLSDPGEGNKYVCIEINTKWSEGTDHEDYSKPDPKVYLTDKDNLKGSVVKYNGVTMITQTTKVATDADSKSSTDTINVKYLAAVREDTPLDVLAVELGIENPVYIF